MTAILVEGLASNVTDHRCPFRMSVELTLLAEVLGDTVTTRLPWLMTILLQQEVRPFTRLILLSLNGIK